MSSNNIMTQKIGKLLIIRHGRSDFNEKDIWAGWVDTHLIEKGIEGAKVAGQIIKKDGFMPDEVHSTILSRAYQTAEYILAALGIPNKEIKKIPELIERHYGGLTGLNKAEMKEKLGDEQFMLYRRSYDVPPPPMQKDNPHHPDNPSDALKVIGFPPNGKFTESLEDVVKRVTPYWHNTLMPLLFSGKDVLVSAHGNSLRALSMVIESMTKEQVQHYEIANSTPILIIVEPSKGEQAWKFVSKKVLAS